MLVDNKPEYFQVYLQMAKECMDKHFNLPKLITIIVWNEWAEGSYLEPDKRHGFGYLEAVKDVFGTQIAIFIIKWYTTKD